MSTDEQRLLISLEGRFAKFERDMARATRNTDKNFSAMERRAALTSQRMRKSFAEIQATISRAGRFAPGLTGPLAGAASIAGAQRLIDSSIRIQNALKATGLEGENLDQVYRKLFASAQQNAAPLEMLAGLYSKLSLVSGDLGVNQQQLLGFTNTVAQALRASGTDAQAAGGALMQLGQALGGTKVQAEEWNSIVDGMPALVRAAAAGIEEAGGSVSRLTQLVKSGQVSSKAFFDGIQAGSHILESQLANSTATVGDGFTRLQNVLIDTAGQFNENADAARILGSFLDDLGAMIQEVGNLAAWLAKPLAEMGGWLNSVNDAATNAGAALGEMLGLRGAASSFASDVRRSLGMDDTGQGDIQNRIDGAFGPLTTPTTGRVPKATAKPRTISLANYAVPSTGAGPSGGGSRSSGGSSGPDDYARQIEQTRKRIALMQAETAALSGVNPLVEDYGAAVETAGMKSQLLAAAQEAGREITPELAAQIDELAQSYGNASAEAQRLAKGQDQARNSARDFAEFGGSLASGFVNDLRQGASASEALANGLNRIVDRLVDMAAEMLIVKPLMSMLGGGGGGSGILSLFGFAGGGEVKGYANGGKISGPGTGKSDSIPILASNGEYMVNAAATRKHRALLEMINADRLPEFANGGAVGGGRAGLASFMGGGSPTINISASATVNANGGDPTQNKNLANQTAKAIEGQLRGLINDEMRRQMRPGNTLRR